MSIHQTIPLIDQMKDLMGDIPGWMPEDQAYTLFNLLWLHPELKGDVVEVGSWCGRSAVVLGHAARLMGGGKVHCIDLFPEKEDWYRNQDGSYSFKVTAGTRTVHANTVHTVWKEPFERQILPVYKRYGSIAVCFNEMVSKNGLADVIAAHRGDSSSFVQALSPGFKCKMIFLDADHGYEELGRDIHLLEPFLVKGGWICFDDAFTTAEGVSKAVTDHIIKNPLYDSAQQMTRKLFIARKR